MTLQWLAVALILAVALVPLGRRLRSAFGWVALIACYGLALSAVAWWQGALERRTRNRAALAEKVPELGRPGGYVSSDTCKSCHPDQYDSWHRSFHRTMTQLPSTETVRGDFENVKLEYAGEKYHLERRGEEFWVDMVDPDWKYVQTLKRASGHRAEDPAGPNAPRSRKRITMLTGSHHMQAYWVASDHGNMQFNIPFTYVFHDQRWFPRNDVFLLDPSIQWIQQVWNVGCISCHSTAGQPRQDPKSKVLSTRTAELGIACEACHGPAEEHIRANLDPARRYGLHSSSGPDPTIFNPRRRNHVQSSEVCGQCHAIRHNLHKDQWNKEGVSFWPGESIESKAPLVRYDGANLDAPGNEKKRSLMEGCFWPDGQVRVSGRDFSAMAASGCYQRGEISCLSCHSMHQYQSNNHQLARGMEGNQACLQCHGDYAAKLEQHTRHRAGSSGSLCYNCHMPYTTYGLLKGIRSHTINSPSVRSSLDSGRPNACNLCHLDKSLGWTAAKLNDWHGQLVPAMTAEQTNTAAGALGLLKGDAGQRALTAWHMGWGPAQAVSSNAWMPRLLAETLVDPYSTVRYITHRSLKSLPGFERFEYDYIGPVAQRTQARERAIETWRGTTRDSSAWLLPEDTIPDLLRQRDNRRMELLE
jgi:predicted CXXCH cytochrome family protein